MRYAGLDIDVVASVVVIITPGVDLVRFISKFRAPQTEESRGLETIFPAAEQAGLAQVRIMLTFAQKHETSTMGQADTVQLSRH